MARYIVIALPDNGEELDEVADGIADWLDMAQITNDVIAPVTAEQIADLVETYPPPKGWADDELES